MFTNTQVIRTPNLSYVVQCLFFFLNMWSVYFYHMSYLIIIIFSDNVELHVPRKLICDLILQNLLLKE